MTKEAITFFFKKYRNLIIAGVLALILLLGGILAFTDWLGNWIDMRGIFRLQTNVNQLANEANQINANLQNLNAENSNMELLVNGLANNHNNAKNGTDQARNATNGALQNLNKVQGKNFNGTSLDEANRLRCQANPSAPECPK